MQKLSIKYGRKFMRVVSIGKPKKKSLAKWPNHRVRARSLHLPDL
jgi:hypothetical protein